MTGLGTLALFLLAVLAGIGAGAIRGGKARSLLEAKVHAKLVGLVCLGLQAIVGALALRPLRTAASFGDVAELAGLFLLVQWLVIGSARREEDAAHGSPKARTVPWSTWAD